MHFEPPPSHRVLVVDHDRTVLEMVQIRLEVAGYLVTAIRDPAAAISLLEAGGFDAVVLERHLPDMASLEVLEALATAAGGPAPVLLIGRGLTADDVRGAAGHGVCDGLAKPFSGAELLERVDRMLAAGAPVLAREPEDDWIEV